MTERYTVTFFGNFALHDPDGQNVTPKGSKARGILALLCETAEMRRGRRWLESKLWSDRTATQASGSLRQALSEIRAAFKDAPDIFEADRLEIWLDSKRIETDLNAVDAAAPHDRDVLEGLDIRDKSFQAWLVEFRTRHTRTIPPSLTHQGSLARPFIKCNHSIKINAIVSEQDSAIERIASNVIADQVTKGLEERLNVERFSSLKANVKPADLEIRCNAVNDDGAGIVFLQIQHGVDGRILFSGHRNVPGDVTNAISTGAIQGLVHSAVDKINHRVPCVFDLNRPEVAAAGFASLGLKNLAQFDPTGLETAQTHFKKAHETDPNGIYLAWRAFARMAQMIESAGRDHKALLEEVQSLTTDALQTSDDNGMAVALVALTRIMLEDDYSAPAELAQKAISYNENNIFARQTLAVVHSAVGAAEKAYQISKTCQHSAPRDDFRHLWDLYHSLVCINSGRFDEAHTTATRASKAAPTFVAPRRQLIALCVNRGDMDAARLHLDAMHTLENGFSLDRYLNDPSYPVLTLRNAGLIERLQQGGF